MPPATDGWLHCLTIPLNSSPGMVNKTLTPMDASQSQKEQERISRFTQQHLADTCSTEVLSPDVVDAICQSRLVRAPNDSVSSQCNITLVESLAISADAIPDCYVTEDQHGLSVIPSLSHLELKEQQKADPSICEVIIQMESGETVPPTVRKELPELPLLLREL